MNSPRSSLAAILLCAAWVPSPADAQVKRIASNDFARDLQDWTENKASRGDVRWVSTGGNPGGYLEFNDSGSSSSSWILAPAHILGDWSRLDSHGVLIFDQKVIHHSGCRTSRYGVSLRGRNGDSAEWRGDLATRAPVWRRVAVPLDEAEWTVTGNWPRLLANVTGLWIKIELVDNSSGCRSGRETTGTDNISLWSAPSAAWDNYGQGWPGRYGVPRISLDELPRIGTTPVVSIVNSQRTRTVGLLIFGVSPASIRTDLGGTLLVSPLALQPIAIGLTTARIGIELPANPLLCGESLYLQALQSDLGASHGLSFTKGLRLRLGT